MGGRREVEGVADFMQAPVAGRVVAVCFSRRRGTAKRDRGRGRLEVGVGLQGDAHAGPGHRQVSLLARESIAKMEARGLRLRPGSFGENLTTEGVDIPGLKVGDRLAVGDSAVLEVTQVGKECHARCAIYYKAGDCIMPREGVFCRVIEPGEVRRGDPIWILSPAGISPVA
ncbi:MAG: MOSC domain-containing protein [Acetobacteraceae bacterium]|nr:MOSC domain-containing protein [Acetobacteraceae bacterium]